MTSIQPEPWLDRAGPALAFYTEAFGATVRAGARATAPVEEEHGRRSGRIVDPFGHEWELGCPW